MGYELILFNQLETSGLPDSLNQLANSCFVLRSNLATEGGSYSILRPLGATKDEFAE